MAARKGRHLPDHMKLRIALLLALITLLIDQASKMWALAALPGRTIPLLGDLLSLQLVRNPGAAFSLGAGSTLVLTLISAVVTVGIVIALRRCRSQPWAIVLGIILGGAVGNLIDRLLREPGFGRGHVIDFINYGGMFIGNIADIALVGGVVALVILELASVPFSPEEPGAVPEGADDSGVGGAAQDNPAEGAAADDSAQAPAAGVADAQLDGADLSGVEPDGEGS